MDTFAKSKAEEIRARVAAKMSGVNAVVRSGQEALVTPLALPTTAIPLGQTQEVTAPLSNIIPDQRPKTPPVNAPTVIELPAPKAVKRDPSLETAADN